MGSVTNRCSLGSRHRSPAQNVTDTSVRKLLSGVIQTTHCRNWPRLEDLDLGLHGVWHFLLKVRKHIHRWSLSVPFTSDFIDFTSGSTEDRITWRFPAAEQLEMLDNAKKNQMHTWALQKNSAESSRGSKCVRNGMNTGSVEAWTLVKEGRDLPVYRNQDLGFRHTGTENESFWENVPWLGVSLVTLGDL